MWTGLSLQPDRPANFAERGAFVPFTTPMLCAARLRLLAGRPEAVIPNPSGTRGVYVIPWSALGQTCAMTLHDRRLAATLAARPVATPLGVRQAARTVAIAGFAGHAASVAARAAEQADDAALRACLAALLNAAPAVAAGHDALARLARVMTPLGLGTPTAWLPRLVAALASLEGDMRQWGAMLSADNGAGMAIAVANQAATTLEWARSAMAAAHRLAPEAMRRLATAPDAITDALAAADRAIWLLDGWERPVLLWQLAQTEPERAATLPEIAAYMPTMPLEIEMVEAAPLVALKPAAPPTQAAAMSAIARNERLRAMAA